MLCLFLEGSLTRWLSPSNKVLKNTHREKQDRHQFLESAVFSKSRLQIDIKLNFFFFLKTIRISVITEHLRGISLCKW